ncbi:hypothetical protein SISSUDRAFT_1050949 [Sistotremastrum suecicum HHB10207 ss-3]|uniref:Uncharacterized protein n=1 Tax=Sistotremastrum suecicum HHB10207 ss-3 TaxID=1314776 RepID=A0A166AW97_9AGAM|nr:hypothetical protein SISSUDRAFT_1050949 [Sistotremastrum suecicum HHB10207 ss-3]
MQLHFWTLILLVPIMSSAALPTRDDGVPSDIRISTPHPIHRRQDDSSTSNPPTFTSFSLPSPTESTATFGFVSIASSQPDASFSAFIPQDSTTGEDTADSRAKAGSG